MKKKPTPIEQVEKTERKKRQSKNQQPTPCDERNLTSRFSFAGNTGGPYNSDELDDINFDPQDNFYLTFGD